LETFHALKMLLGQCKDSSTGVMAIELQKTMIIRLFENKTMIICRFM
jgi:hypothetical protein